MVDKLRRHVALFVLAILGWLVWSDLHPDTGEKKAEAKVVRLEIDPSFLAIRPATDPPMQVFDVFRFGAPAASSASGAVAVASVVKASSASGTTATGTASGTHDAPTGWRHWLGTLGHQFGAAMASPPRGPSAATAVVAHPLHPFVMHLESTLSLSVGGQARISGHTVSVGDSLDWLDPEDPPKLLAVQGTSATVGRGMDTWVLDLQGNAYVAVGTPEAAVAQLGAATPAAMGNPRATRPPRTTPGGAAGSAPRAPAAKPAGSSNGYRVRSYPGKPK